MSQSAPGDSPEPHRPLSDDERADLLNELLRRHASQLGEHFSSVRIIASSLESDGCTRRFQQGAGDYYAQRGAVRAWLIEEEMSRE